MVIMGDFNVDELKDDRMKTLMKTLNFSQLIKEPTRETIKTKTLIDYIYVSNECNFSTAGIIPLGISDHHLTYTIPNQHTTIKYRDNKHLDENKLLVDMRKIGRQSRKLPM